MKRLWRFILETIKRILGIGRNKIREETEADLNEERFKSKRNHNRIVRLFTGQWGHGGPNMPKKQPCPQCSRRGKRDRKTVSGAIYNCTRCDMEFLVVNRRVAAANLGKIAAGAV